MITYATFIEALPPLVRQAQALLTSTELADGVDFRRWRHDLRDLVQRIEAKGYSVNCGVGSRAFRIAALGGPISKERQRAWFLRELQDTVGELELLCSRHGQFGDPRAAEDPSPRGPSTPLTSPEKVTLAWLWQHAPIRLWGSALFFLAVVFVSGVTLGQSKLYAELQAKLRPVAASAQKP